MDPQRSALLAQGPSRRRLLQVLGGALAAGSITGLGNPHDVAAEPPLWAFQCSQLSNVRRCQDRNAGDDYEVAWIETRA